MDTQHTVHSANQKQRQPAVLLWRLERRGDQEIKNVHAYTRPVNKFATFTFHSTRRWRRWWWVLDGYECPNEVLTVITKRDGILFSPHWSQKFTSNGMSRVIIQSVIHSAEELCLFSILYSVEKMGLLDQRHSGADWSFAWMTGLTFLLQVRKTAASAMTRSGWE